MWGGLWPWLCRVEEANDIGKIVFVPLACEQAFELVQRHAQDFLANAEAGPKKFWFWIELVLVLQISALAQHRLWRDQRGCKRSIESESFLAVKIHSGAFKCEIWLNCPMIRPSLINLVLETEAVMMVLSST